MDQKDKLVYRCPVCFSRENDIVLFKDKQQYYCIKCSFRGTLDDIQDMYSDLRKKYRLLKTRITLEEQRNW